MSKDIHKKIVYKNPFGFILLVIVSWGFVIMSAFAGYLPGLLFFGLCAIVNSWPFLDPGKKVIFTGTKKYHEQIEKELQEAKSTEGIFTYTEDGFSVEVEKEILQIKWKEIRALFAFKVDLYTVDSIRLDVFYGDNLYFGTSEDTEGWYVFIDHLSKQFPEINKQWHIQIAFPAFETNLTLLYEKENKGLEEAVVLYYKNT